MSIRNQKDSGILCPDEKSEDNRIRSAWVAITSPLKCVPEPRGPWDNAKSSPRYTPWRFILIPIKGVARAAAVSGDRERMERVARRVHDFFCALEAECLSPIPRSDEATILKIALEETHEQASEDSAVQELLADIQPYKTPDPVTCEKAETAINRHIAALQRLGNRVGSFLRSGRPRFQVHA